MDTRELTSLLRKNGHLGEAIVTEVQLTPIKTTGIASNFYLADLLYSSADHTLPNRMAIKRSTTSDRGRGEADVYEHILTSEVELPVMKCFGVLDEGAEKPLSLLFEDLTDSHSQTTWPIIPNASDCEGAVATLAKIHANWWGKTTSLDRHKPVVEPHQDANHLATFFPSFVDFVGEYLSPVRIAHYEHVFANLDTLLSNRMTMNNTTLLHTDPHFWNFLYPKNHNQDRYVIFDWPLWRTGLGGWDLAYMIGLHLYPEHRQRFEPRLLNKYLLVLNEEGIDCDYQDVHLDYRIGVIVGLLMPVMEFSWKNPTISWMPKLEKALAAFEELNCGELIEAI